MGGTGVSKVYLDHCYFCLESKAAIKHSQSIKDPIFCGSMSGGESPEVDWERDRHCFVVTDAMAEAEYYKSMVEYFDNSPLEATA